MEANIAAYPDFDRVLHPEKYPASTTPPITGAGSPAPAAPGAANAPAAATTPAPVPVPAAKATTTPPSPPSPGPPAKPGAKTGALWWSPALSLLFPKVPEMLL